MSFSFRLLDFNWIKYLVGKKAKKKIYQDQSMHHKNLKKPPNVNNTEKCFQG